MLGITLSGHRNIECRESRRPPALAAFLQDAVMGSKCKPEGVKELSGAGASSLVLEVENLAAARGLRVLFEGLNLRVSGGEIA